MADKERVRVQAGRGGGPKQAAAAALPATVETKKNLPAARGEPRSMLAIISEAAANPDVNVDKMEALLKMQRDIENSASIKEFNRAFIALQEELPTVNRDGKIEVRKKDASGERTGAIQQATPYATFNNIMKVLKPILLKHGFVLSFATAPTTDGRIDVKGYLDHIGGHRRETSFPLPAETSGSKNNVQGWGSSLSYGKRYATIALLNVVSEAKEDTDTDGHEGHFKTARVKGAGEALVETTPVELITDDQLLQIREMIEWCGVGVKKFCEHFGIAKVSDLPANMFETAKKDCQDYRANQERKAQAAQQQPTRGGYR